jgi:TetR/AcrR family tetracycline transcriptional repressor
MRPGPRRSLKQSDLVDAAFELLAASGFSAVSIRGVAASLNLTPTAMYTYFASKQELLRAMVGELFAGVAVADVAGVADGADASGAADAPGAPRAQDPLLVAAVQIRAKLREHPGSVALVTGEAVAGSGTLELIERLGRSFQARGLGLDDAARAAHALLAHTIGQLALEQAWRGASADAGDAALWTDEPARPIADAGERLGLRAGDDTEFEAATARLLTAWAP